MATIIVSTEGRRKWGHKTVSIETLETVYGIFWKQLENLLQYLISRSNLVHNSRTYINERPEIRIL